MKVGTTKQSRQLVGNIGLYYVCFELSKRGWNVLPTSRNAKGVDIVIYNQSATKKPTIQVKALSSRAAVGCSSNKVIGDYMIICRKILDDKPETFIATKEEIQKYIIQQKDGSCWINPKDYENDLFKDKWEKIGNGYD